MRPKVRKQLGILALAPIAALSVASLLNGRSVVKTMSSLLVVDINFLRSSHSDESAMGRNSSFGSQESYSGSFFSLPTSPSNGNTALIEDVNVGRDRDSFSACLLVMDDNFRLPEWVAYHYYTMNLRHLVVAVDPRSRTSPSSVLDRWRKRLRVEVWTNDTFVATRNCTTDTSQSINMNLKKDAHRCRQKEFYQSCARHLKRLNRTWTSFHDVDEFLVVPSSPRANFSRHGVVPEQPGRILKLIQQFATYRDKNESHPGKLISRDETNWPYWLSLPCFTVPRVLFSAAEFDSLPTQDVESTSLPAFVNPAQLDTLRYRYQATPTGGADGLAKSIMDVSRLPIDASANGTARGRDKAVLQGNAHRPYRDFCTHAWPKPGALPLVIHHYLGSWEAFSFRDDARRGGLRTIEKWRERSDVRLGGVNDDARNWIQGFIRMVGDEAAQELLKDAGLPPDYKMSDNKTALWRAQT